MAVVLASCGTTGTGSVRTESREVRGFSSVQLTGSGEATIQQTGAESLAIEAEENLLPLLTSEVSTGGLTLGTKPGASINPTRPIIYRVTLRDLAGLSVSGSGSQTVGAAKTGSLRIEVSGSGSISVAETADPAAGRAVRLW